MAHVYTEGRRISSIIFSIIAFAIVGNILSDVPVEEPSEHDKELKLVHLIFRHGQRTPADTFPLDPHKDATFYPSGWGQLTNEGKLQMFELGKYLRGRYGEYLGDYYSPDVSYTQTTDVDRTKMSAQLISAGLWPPGKDQKWGPLQWLPIPVNNQPLNQDSLLLVRIPCPKYSIERENLEKSDYVQSIYSNNKAMFEELTKLTGRPVKNAEDILDIQGTLRAEKDLHLEMPSWVGEYYEKLIPLTELSFILNSKTPTLQRFKGGVLLKKILNDWIAKSKNELKPAARKVFLYGGHDSTISNLLLALSVWESQIPEYGSTILLELSQKKSGNKEYGIEIYFKNETNQDPYPLQLPGCEHFCPLDKIIELTKPVIPVDFTEECKIDDDSYVPPPPGGP